MSKAVISMREYLTETLLFSLGTEVLSTIKYRMTTRIITFDYDNQRYIVSRDACDARRTVIRLPDKRLLRVNGWIERTTPKPQEVVLIDKEAPDDTIFDAEIAAH